MCGDMVCKITIFLLCSYHIYFVRKKIKNLFFWVTLNNDDDVKI